MGIRYYRTMPLTLARVVLLVAAVGPANIWPLGLPPRQLATCSTGVLCADSDACGDGCQCAPLLGGSLGGVCMASPTNASDACDCVDGFICNNRLCVLNITSAA